ncbi:nuclear transport factor 2 family protein [Hyalangium versicolor]|uniref:nuclear transport factor 2 family protein n=1 Tax=Hyalangium versicolor TaxID=2861190 RepID=UPI001CCDF165|nr:nuclear transport factor 2 family protein [Hyalangium versicolor]
MTAASTPRNAGALLDAHLELIGTDIERWLELFAEDAVVEFPYAGSLGVPSRLEGLEAIRRYFVETPKHFRGLVFSNIRRYLTTDPEVAFGEVHGSATIASTGRRYEQDYIMMVKARDGRISFYREYWDPLLGLKAFGGEENLQRMVRAS